MTTPEILRPRPVEEAVEELEKLGLTEPNEEESISGGRQFPWPHHDSFILVLKRETKAAASVDPSGINHQTITILQPSSSSPTLSRGSHPHA